MKNINLITYLITMIIPLELIVFSYYYREKDIIISLITSIISAIIFFKQIYNIIKLLK